MPITRWGIWELLQASQFLVNLPQRLVAKNSKAEEDRWESNALAMAVVVKAVVRIGLYLQWRIWEWPLESMVSM